MPDSSPTVTELLGKWKAGDQDALDTLVPLVYQELRRMARRHMASERTDHTLQHTALVHEAFLRLVDSNVAWNDRAHFFAVASRAMRRILVDHARSKGRQKRASGETIPIDDDRELPDRSVHGPDILVLHDILERLTAQNRRQGEIVEMHYFSGLTAEEIAAVVQISARTVERELKSAKDWMGKALEEC